MFVRKKKNRSGTTSVIVVDKSNNRFREVKSIGTSSNEEGIEDFVFLGRKWIDERSNGADMFASKAQEQEELYLAENLLSNIDNILLNGTQLILDKVYDSIGFDAIEDRTLRHLVIYRLCQPQSKAATVDYLKSHFDEDVRLHQLYRYLDKLNSQFKDRLQEISVQHTRKVLGNAINIVFYDVTTLYFESDKSDELRKPGYSKDGKHSLPQIVLGLLVSIGGYPLAYAIHEGNKYEGHTMLPVVDGFVEKYDLKDFVVVADSGLMNKSNIDLLEQKDYKYIIGARIKNESKEVKSWILSLEKKDGLYHFCRKSSRANMIVGYSSKRARKDEYNRQKGISRLEKEFKSGVITKDKVNKRGYNKFLKVSNNVEVEVDYSKIEEDSKWDGLKGYITNTNLAPELVHEQYSGLWQVEKAFRVTKGTLELRPMFHFTPKRIEAHICICFVAYKVYKELERLLKLNNIELSADKVLAISKTITTVQMRLQSTGKIFEKTMLITDSHKSIAMLFEDDFWKN
ncbi:MAG: IS1634 family transposase [Mangrovibacterium sp.]